MTITQKAEQPLLRANKFAAWADRRTLSPPRLSPSNLSLAVPDVHPVAPVLPITFRPYGVRTLRYRVEA